MTMSKHNVRRHASLAVAAVMAVPLTGCVTVEPPDRPIEINLKIDITQEVLVRLQEDVDRLIQENPEAFPQTQPPGGAE